MSGEGFSQSEREPVTLKAGFSNKDPHADRH
jgi:hypothetical protein